MICISIIYRVRIISIANVSCGFMVFDTLYLLNTYQIVNDNSVVSDRYIYLYCHMYKAPITTCVQDIILNHFVYREVVEELPTYSNRQIYYGDRSFIIESFLFCLLFLTLAFDFNIQNVNAYWIQMKTIKTLHQETRVTKTVTTNLRERYTRIRKRETLKKVDYSKKERTDK